MALKIRDAGTLRTIAKLQIKDGNALRNIRSLKIMDGGTLRTIAVFAPPLSATIAPTLVGGVGSGAGPETVYTSAATATPTGGFSPYRYAWTLTTNSGGTASSALSPTMASTTFAKPAVAVDATYTDTWTVTVTDAFGDTATATVSARFRNFDRGINTNE